MFNIYIEKNKFLFSAKLFSFVQCGMFDCLAYPDTKTSPTFDYTICAASLLLISHYLDFSSDSFGPGST